MTIRTDRKASHTQYGISGIPKPHGRTTEERHDLCQSLSRSLELLSGLPWRLQDDGLNARCCWCWTSSHLPGILGGTEGIVEAQGWQGPLKGHQKPAQSLSPLPATSQPGRTRESCAALLSHLRRILFMNYEVSLTGLLAVPFSPYCPYPLLLILNSWVNHLRYWIEPHRV